MKHLFFTVTLLAGAVLLPSGQLVAAEGDTTTIKVTGTLVEGPQCTVNTNNVVNVNFGTSLVTRMVDGANYKKEIIYDLTCTGPTSTALKLTIRGTLASFGSGLLTTSKSGLGIRLFSGSAGTTTLTPGSYVNFNGTANRPRLWAVPVAQNSATLTAGSFTGTGTMVIDYQ
ncbi:fimbrial protein [Entomohabitans teleogrylli]|uniref:fimbrial protein n=1 Tax=Entomohabitans teleogrylli TaxID=1384589 RepID=UPI00073D5935|nr:fimbrial protein [Entomohabitans teleogrylli]